MNDCNSDSRPFLFGLGIGILAGIGLNACKQKCSPSPKSPSGRLVPPPIGTCYLAPGDSFNDTLNSGPDLQQVLLSVSDFVYCGQNTDDKNLKTKIYLGGGEWAILCPILNGKSTLEVQYTLDGSLGNLDMGDSPGRVWIVEDAFLRISGTPLLPRIKIKTKGGTAAASGTLFYVRRGENAQGNPLDHATIVVINGRVDVTTQTSSEGLHSEQYAEVYDNGRIGTVTSLP